MVSGQTQPPRDSVFATLNYGHPPQQMQLLASFEQRQRITASHRSFINFAPVRFGVRGVGSTRQEVTPDAEGTYWGERPQHRLEV
jgi:hypothetical protein